MHTQPTLQLDDVIDDRLEMQRLHPQLFDDYLATGWRLLGNSMVRHNFSVCRRQMCRAIPLRIQLDGFKFSKSQRQLLRRNAHLDVRPGPIRLTDEKITLFDRHSERFEDRRPMSVRSFLGANTHREPVPGQELSIYIEGNLAACSFIHLGQEGVSATYCFFAPEYHEYGLGNYTMLLEILEAQRLGKRYYYHGYCNDVPSGFDYKLNFNNLEALNWATGFWEPQPRQPVRRWADLVEPASPGPGEEVAFSDSHGPLPLPHNGEGIKGESTFRRTLH
ncbi:MAG: hypothetical protein LH618_19590 [Saprospiraceae bacterium]|nr:hypothetical protein [Saprospiraceae bacterium]